MPLLVQTEYMVSAARVCLHMPSQGDTWFFVDPKTTIGDFTKSCLQEDTQLSSVEVLTATGTLANDSKVYELLEQREPLYLRMNNITYQFDTVAKNESVDVVTESSYYQKCIDAGLNIVQANTIATLTTNLLKNLPSNKSFTADDLS